MFGCLRRLGCLVVLVALAAAAYVYRDRWTAYLPLGRRAASPAAAPPATAGAWEPVSDAGAARARSAITRLGQRSGPVFANLGAGDLASYIYQALARQLPPSSENVQAAVIGERVYVRADVPLDALKQGGGLGPLASMLGSREPMQLGGRFDIVRPGLAEFLVEDVKVRDFTIPSAMIPRLLERITRGPRPAGVATNGLPLSVPPYIGDVRIGRGKITLYKTVP